MKSTVKKNYRKTAGLLILVFFFGLMVAEGFAAQPGQILLNGKVKSIDLATSTVVVTDYEGKDFSLSIEDKEIMAKFIDKRIKVGDDVNVKYIVKDGKNVPFSLRKTAGC